MKKRMIIGLAICVILIGVVIYFQLPRIKGSVEVVINDETYIVKDIKCIYISAKEMTEKLYDKKDGQRTYFRNRGIGYGKYVYSFDIAVDKLSTSPKITFFKTNQYKFQEINICLNIREKDNIWYADIIMRDRNKILEQWKIEDLENNDIELQFGP